jgi:hypothetical protein
MKLKRIGAVALALLAVSATAAVAATWQTGDYKGKTDGKYCAKKTCRKSELRRARISFTVKRHKITNIHYEMRVHCKNGNHSSFLVEPTGSLPLDGDGKFSGSAPSPRGTGEDRISGKVGGTQASGTVRSFDKENAHHKESATGSKCDSGKVAWSTKKK